MRTLKEILAEALSNTQIFEMAHSRENYLRTIACLVTQIVQNWCLVKYCNLYDEENYNRLHWSKELMAHLENLRSVKLKKGLNKTRVTKQAMVEYSELNDSNMVSDMLGMKWEEENLPEDSINAISKEFVKDIDKIIDLVSTGSYGELKNYVYKEI